MIRSRRVSWIVWLLSGAVLLGVVVAALAMARGGRTTLTGMDLDGIPTQDFRLVNQRGEPVELADLRGKVVALTFLYTSCPDVCPLVAANLRDAYARLGAAGKDVALVAVSVDPERDSVARVRQYSEAMGMPAAWQFLTGERGALEQVWADFYVSVSPPASPGGEVKHTGAIYLLDRQGRKRVLLPVRVPVKDLVNDVRILLRDPS